MFKPYTKTQKEGLGIISNFYKPIINFKIPSLMDNYNIKNRISTEISLANSRIQTSIEKDAYNLYFHSLKFGNPYFAQEYFKKNFNDYITSFANKVPEFLRGKVYQKKDQMILSFLPRFLSWQQQVNKGKRLYSFISALSQNSGIILSNLLSGREEEKKQADVVFKKTLDSVNSALEQGLISPLSYAHQLDKLKTTYNVYSHVGIFNRLLQTEGSGKASEYIDNLLKNNPDKLTSEELHKIKTLTSTLFIQDRVAREGLEANFNDVYKYMINAVKKGHTVSPAEIEMYSSVFSPRQITKLFTDVNVYENAYKLANQYATVPVYKIPLVLEELEKKKNEDTGKYEEKDILHEKIYESAQNILKEKYKQMLTDPVSYIQTLPSFQKILSKYNIINNTGTPYKVPQDYLLVKYQQQLGIPANKIRVQPLAHDKSDAMFLKQADLYKQLLFLSQKEKEYPNTFDYYINNIAKENAQPMLPLIYNLYKKGDAKGILLDINNTSKVRLSELKEEAKNAFDTSFVLDEINTAVSEVLKPYLSAFYNSYSSNIEDIANIRKTLLKLSLTKMIRDGEWNPEESVQYVYNNLIGNFYTIKDNLIIPKKYNNKEIDTDKIFDKLHSLKKKLLPNYHMPFIESLIKTKDIASAALENLLRGKTIFHSNLKNKKIEVSFFKANTAHWVNYGAPNSFILIDGNGNPIIKDNHPIIEYLDDLIGV